MLSWSRQNASPFASGRHARAFAFDMGCCESTNRFATFAMLPLFS